MGGSTMSDIGDTAVGVVKDAVKVTSGGVVNVDDGLKINLNPMDAGKDWLSGATGGNTTKSLMPEMPKMPTAMSAAEQAKRAEAAAGASIRKQTSGVGLSSTILGGSTSSDNSVLKKKKLLGE